MAGIIKPVEGTTMSVKRYDKNYKIEVVRRVMSKDKTAPDLAKELGIHVNNGWENSRRMKKLLFLAVET